MVIKNYKYGNFTSINRNSIIIPLRVRSSNRHYKASLAATQKLKMAKIQDHRKADSLAVEAIVGVMVEKRVKKKKGNGIVTGPAQKEKRKKKRQEREDARFHPRSQS